MATMEVRAGKSAHARKRSPNAVRSVAACLQRLNADEQGVAALEFALLLPLLATLMLATADLTLVTARNFQVQSLAQTAAGAIASLPILPAAPTGQDGRSGGISTAIARATMPDGLPTPSNTSGQPIIPIGALVSLPADAQASSVLFWGCSANARLLPVRTSRCPDGARPAAYAEIIVRAPVKRLIAWPDRLLASEVVARAVVRLG